MKRSLSDLIRNLTKRSILVCLRTAKPSPMVIIAAQKDMINLAKQTHEHHFNRFREAGIKKSPLPKAFLCPKVIESGLSTFVVTIKRSP